MTHSYVNNCSFICVPWLIHMCAMTHSYVCHDSFICAPCLIHTCDVTHSHAWHDSFINVASPIHTPATDLQFCWTLLCVTWLLHTCVMIYSTPQTYLQTILTHWCLCHDSLVRVPWLTHTCTMTHSPSQIYCKWLGLTHTRAMPLHTCDMTHPNW